MENPSARHQEFYLEVAQASGIDHKSFHPDFAERVRNSSDPHLNDIPLSAWDRLSVKSAKAIQKAIEERGGVYDHDDGVCAWKSAALHYFKSRSYQLQLPNDVTVSSPIGVSMK